jgi:hypothetical protein
MDVKTGAAILLAVTIGADAAHACDRIDACDLRAYVDKTEFEEFKNYMRDFKNKSSRRPSPQRSTSTTVKSTNKVSAAASAASAPPVSAYVAPPPTTSLIFLLRKDFADIGLFSAPSPTKGADGAEFSLTRDKIANDTTWSADATAAVAYTYFEEDISTTFIGAAIAPYVKLNREIHSNNLDHNLDAKTVGVSGEVGFRNRLLGRGADYFRGRFAVIEDDVRSTTIGHGTAEWLPTYLWDARTIPGTFINYNFTPELKVQYDSTTERGKTLLFSGRQESLRIGPEASLHFKVVAPDGFLSDYLKRVVGSFTYHWWTEVYSGRQNSWLDASLVYNLDEEGHIGLKFGYKRGYSEETGAKLDLYKISLTAKTCADLVTKQQC